MTRLTVCTLASLCLAVAVALAVGGKAHASLAEEIDLFPSQSWNSLLNRGGAQPVDSEPEVEPSVDAEQEALTSAAAPIESEPAEPPLKAVGEWVEGEHRIIVLEHQGETYLLCQRCDVAQAVKPGGRVAQQYQFEALEPTRAVLQDPQGRVLHIDLAPLAQ